MTSWNPNYGLDCAAVDELLADYVDQTLGDADASAVKLHLEECEACRELAADATSAVGFMERAALVDASPELINRVLFQVSADPHSVVVKNSWPGRLLGKWFHPRLGLARQPRFAMSVVMMALSMGTAARLDGPWHLADLDPVKVWTAAEVRATRVWDRSVKYYRNQEIVVKLESQYQEWMLQQQDGRNP